MRAQYEVYIVGPLEGGRFLGGADTAREGYSLHAAFAAETAKLSEVPFHAVHGVLANVAGVEYYEIRVLVALDLRVARVLDHPPYAIGVVYVHLAAEGPDAGCLGA